ncbi:MAG: nucleotidyltransferase domain-containing protein [Bacteroidetes bacterium]|nr:nucleotidyltransferase domain-containing protein [Bacteroidota bacterium]
MTLIDSHLSKLVKQLTIDKIKKETIDNSFEILKGKIWAQYQDRVKSVELFGSYQRGTKLPQSVDNNSDVDILVIFKSNDFQPATLLKHLYQFADSQYSRSDVTTDHPTVVIEMTNVRFEIVPAYWEEHTFLSDELKIPAPRNKELKWITTEPHELKLELDEKNKDENNLITPLIKLIKYYNAQRGRPFDSYLIEHHAIKLDYDGETLKDYLFTFIEELDTDNATSQQAKFVEELKLRRKNILTLEESKMEDYAIQELNKFLPLITQI